MSASEAARKERIQAALSAGTNETHRVHFRAQVNHLPVVRLSLNDAVLNHRSHRIRSQLEGSPMAETISSSPESDEAQAAIRDILRSTPGFAALKENLGGPEGQREPGVVTHTGLLINANTRAVALADLGKEYIDVAVLPSDTTIEEMYALEADLQVAADFKQPYTFTNELLFVHDLIEDQDRSETDVALRMRWATPGKPPTKGVEQVRRYTRHLAYIREIQALSGNNIPLTEFDDTEQTLLEFDARYEALRVKDPAGAGEMKTAQMLALLADLGYKASREIKPGWTNAHLAEALGENELLTEVMDAVETPAAGESDTQPEGLDVLEGLGDAEAGGGRVDTPAQLTVSMLVERLGRSAKDENVALPTPNGEKEFSRTAVLGAVQDAMKAAAESARETAKAGTQLKQPAELCRDAGLKLTKASAVWDRVHSDDDFDPAEFQDAFEQAERALEALRLKTSL